MDSQYCSPVMLGSGQKVGFAVLWLLKPGLVLNLAQILAVCIEFNLKQIIRLKIDLIKWKFGQ